MIGQLVNYARLTFGVIFLKTDSMRQAAEDKWAIIPGIIFLSASLFLLSNFTEGFKDYKGAFSFNAFSILVFLAFAMILGGADNLVRFVRVFSLASALDFLFLPFIVQNKMSPGVSLIYSAWTLTIYTFIFNIVFNISKIKGLLTVIAASSIIILVLLMTVEQNGNPDTATPKNNIQSIEATP